MTRRLPFTAALIPALLIQVLLLAHLGVAPAWGQTQEDRYDQAGSFQFTVPAGVTEITVEVWGGGGSGGPASGNGRRRSGGGGGGAFASSALSVTPGQVLDLSVGAGSTGNATGEDSWFSSPTVVRAAGGESVPTNQGDGGLGGLAANSVGDITFDGGDGAGRAGRNAGGGGSSAGTGQAGNDAGGSAGAAAPAGGGDGGDGSTTDNGDGQDGQQPGGGGGGATAFFDSFDGGAGGDGLVIVRYTLPQIELLAEYRMEQPEWTGAPGEVVDSSGNVRDATPVGGAATALIDPALPGNPGTCRYGEFDGSNDGVDQPGAWLEGLSAVTVMAWVYNSASLAGNNRGVFFTGQTGAGRDNRLGLRYDESGFFGGGSNVIKASVSTTDCPDADECIQVETSSDVMVRDQWQHLAMTWESGGNLKVYVDGVEVGLSAQQGQGTGGVIDAVSALNIGQGSKDQRWQGRIDEFRVFRGALTANDIDDWRTRTFPCDAAVPEHIRLLHPGTGLTCRPESINVSACADAACTSLLSSEVTVTLTSPAGNWSPNPVTFTGSTTVSLQVPTPGSVVLDASSDPAANSPTRCFTGGVEDCSMQWFDSGFVIDAPDHVAATPQQVTIQAVRTDEPTQTCAPAFANETRTVGFWSEYENPASGALPVVLDGTAIGTSSPGTGLGVAFDGNSLGSLPIRYADVGQVRLRARYDGSGPDAGLVMLGSDAFIARPAGFGLAVPGNPSAGGAAGPVFTAAGVPFEVEVTSLNAAGNATPNFGRESPAESVSVDIALLAPAGASPPLGGSFDAFGQDCIGDGAPGTACGDFSWPEVGIIEPTPRLADGAYLETADVVGPVGSAIGRFIPAYFTLDSVTLDDRTELSGCSSPLTYFGERIGLDWLLGARAASGAMTTNYRGDFARLGAAGLGLGADDTLVIDAAAIAWTAGSGAASAEVHVERVDPREPLDPFRIGTAPVDPDAVTLTPTDFDVDLDEDGADDHGLLGSTELRYGRIVVENAVGSELGPVALPLSVLEFRNSTWQTNADDDCTALALADEIGLISSGGDDTDGSATVSVGGGTTSIQESDPVTVIAGESQLTFSAPGAVGWVDLTLLLGDDWPFLRDDLDDDGAYDDDPTARASFGLFDGSENRILLQEIDPQ